MRCCLEWICLPRQWDRLLFPLSGLPLFLALAQLLQLLDGLLKAFNLLLLRLQFALKPLELRLQR